MARGRTTAAQAAGAETQAERPPLHEAGISGTWVGSRARAPRMRSARLSGKERAVLRELARGHSTEEIAELLYVSPHTVRTHIKNGMRKLEAKTRAHAVAIALSDGAIDIRD
jgi:DNA-binding CsgD family transcriptional regulator